MDLKKIFKKAALIGAGFLIGGFFDYTLFHNVPAVNALVKTLDPFMQSFWEASGLPWLADQANKALGGHTADEAKQELASTTAETPSNILSTDGLETTTPDATLDALDALL